MLTVYYKIRGEGERYVMPDVGTPRTSGISLEAEFEVYQDQDSGHLLGIVVFKELAPSPQSCVPKNTDSSSTVMALLAILDTLVTEYGLTRMPFAKLEPTVEAISLVLRAAYHFYLHLRRTPRVENDTGKGLADFVEIEMAEIEHDNITFNDDFEPVLSPIKANWKRGKVFDLQIDDNRYMDGRLSTCKYL
jgi:hypothetical protein